jgi:HlyD family secretion protein
MAMKKRNLIIILIVVVMLAAGFFLLSSLLKSNALPDFQLTEVLRGDLEIVVSSTGTLSAVETVAVGAEVSGTVNKVYVDYNDTVETEDLLAVIDPTAFIASVQEAEASVMKAEAMVEKARAEYERNRKLYEKGHLSEFECLTLETSLKTAEADLLSAGARLVQAQNNLENTEIRSPISGTVIERSVDAGQTIASSYQAPELFTIAEDLKKMHIEADVDENDIGQIVPDQRVRFTVQAYPDLVFEGNVRQVRLLPETVQNVVNYTVVIDVSNDEGLLLPGMTATIDFIILDHPDALLVPNSALSFQPPAPDEATESGLFSRPVKSAQGEEMHDRPVVRELPTGKARVFYMTEEAYPRVAFFIPGESDGIYTEILESADLREGMRIVTGVSSPDNKKQPASRNSLLPTPGRPPGGRPM